MREKDIKRFYPDLSPEEVRLLRETVNRYTPKKKRKAQSAKLKKLIDELYL